MTARRVGLAAGIAAVALAGCGEDRYGSNSTSGGTTPPPSGAPAVAAGSVDVSETEFKLSPASVRVDRPATVAIHIRNDGGVGHALEVEGPQGESKTGTIAPGKSATLNVKLAKAGTYEWYCPVADHKDRGMKGEIVVGSGRPRGKDDRGGGGSGSGSGGGSGSGSGGGSGYGSSGY